MKLFSASGWLRGASILGSILAVASVAVYTKPCSFYVNFVIIPSVTCLAASLACTLLAVALTLVLRHRGVLDRSSLRFTVVAIAFPVAAFLVIGVMANTISCVPSQ